MGYIQDMERELKSLLGGAVSKESEKNITKFVLKKILESYKNGIKTAVIYGSEKQAEKQTRKFSRGK